MGNHVQVSPRTDNVNQHKGVTMSRNTSRACIVCPCHDVTRNDIEAAVEQGHTDPETIKRATAVYMGSCQGKFCAPLVQDILVELGVEQPNEQRRPAARIPVEPITLGMLMETPEGANE